MILIEEELKRKTIQLHHFILKSNKDQVSPLF